MIYIQEMVDMSTGTGKKTFIVASHTHWDREWYSPFQEFRLRLVEHIDELIHVLSDGSGGYHSFNFDGQTVVLEDYLEIRPENEGRLKKLISERKLLVGPWYILPDEFLVGGESYVHNLLRGKTISERFGHFSKVGYLPDCFGHIAQIPQILKGFDIDNIIFWRGLGLERPYPEIFWQGPDGTKLFGLHLVESYGDTCTGDLKTLAEKVQRFKKVIDFYHAYSQIGTAMMMNGVDHMPVDLDIVEVMKQINTDPTFKAEVRQGTFEEYIDILRKEQSLNWPTFKGILRDTKLQEKTGNYILNGVLSARIYMKQANVKSQMTLLRWAEPFAVMEKLFYGCDRRSFLEKAWTWLLKNHPHDSIGGCSVDSVHRQMMTRFEWCQDICGSIFSRTFHKLTSRTQAAATRRFQLAVFNPQPVTVSEAIEAEITVPKTDLQEMTWSDGAVFKPGLALRGVRLRRPNGPPLEAQLVGVSEKVHQYPALRELAPLRTCLVAKVRLWVESLPALGFEKFDVEFLNSPVFPAASLFKGPNVMENSFLKVVVNSDGTLTVTDKSSGKAFTNVLYYEDGGDVGDEYNFSKPMNDEIVTTLGASAQIGIAYDGPDSCTFAVEHNLAVPADIEADSFAAGLGSDPYQKRSSRKVNMPIRTEITLGKNARYLKVTTTVDNQAKWHRLRAMFPTYLKTDFVQAEQQYDVADFPVAIRQPSAKVWMEDQPIQYPQQDFVDMTDGKTGLAVFNKGLPEFEIVPNEARTIAVTLLRCVGYLSRATMNSRSNNAGPAMETPEAQCPGLQTFEMAIYPHKGDWVEGGVLPLARQFAAGIKTFTPLPNLADNGQDKFSLLSLEGTGIALDACKPAQEGDAVIVRVTNYSGRNQQARVQIHFPFLEVRYSRLDELVLSEGPKVTGNTVELEIGAKKIITLAIR
jgi:mannosylglycerate hydrolase